MIHHKKHRILVSMLIMSMHLRVLFLLNSILWQILIRIASLILAISRAMLQNNYPMHQSNQIILQIHQKDISRILLIRDSSIFSLSSLSKRYHRSKVLYSTISHRTRMIIALKNLYHSFNWIRWESVKRERWNERGQKKERWVQLEMTTTLREWR